MSITAKVIADSVQQVYVFDNGKWVPSGTKNRLTTLVLRYPRFIHAELMTHRVFSRNASSSRAIPVQKMIDAVMTDPAMPVFWGKNQAGMQAAEELAMYVPVPDDYVGETFQSLPRKIPGPRMEARTEWLKARDHAVEHVKKLMEIGLHKQIANRILEPWMHIEVIVTSTDWANFYALRRHKAAQPEMKMLADVAYEAHHASVPKVLDEGEWHLPYIVEADYEETKTKTLGPFKTKWYEGQAKIPFFLPKISAARCARVSYLKHDGTPATFTEDMDLFERLMDNPDDPDIKHASPTEHQARVPLPSDLLPWNQGGEMELVQSNLHGWTQFRKLIKGEKIQKYEEFER